MPIDFLRRLLGRPAPEPGETRYAPPALCGTPRSPQWATVRNRFLKGKVCLACGRADQLNAHHVKPYHLYPHLELDPANLVPLCEGVTACHYLCGHGGLSWLVAEQDPHAAARQYAQFLAAIRAHAH